MGATRPPRWATALLAAVLPGGVAGTSVRADLDQEFTELLVTVSPWRARWWYGWEALKLTAHFTVDSIWRAASAVPRLDSWASNVRFGLRHFRRSPGFSVTAVGTIALGIGATVTIFSVIKGVLLEPLPYDEPGDLVAIWEWNRPRDVVENVANPGNFSAWRDRSASFEGMSAVSLGQPATVVAAGNPQESMIQYALPDFFSLLGMRAEIGRTFLDPMSDDTDEVVLSHRYWRERFAGDSAVVGTTIQINGTSSTIAGVLPDEFVLFGERTDLWRALTGPIGDQSDSGRWMMVVGRLTEDTSLERARTELLTISAALEEEFPDFNGGWSVTVNSLQEEVTGDVTGVLWMLFSAVGLLQLIASANVANLFVVRATSRRREMAVRTSIGASRAALVQLVFTESLVVAAVGAGLGIAMAAAATTWITTAAPAAFALPRIESAGLDPVVLGFAALLTGGTALIFGVLPATQASRTAPAGTLGAESRGVSRRTTLARDVLVMVEVGLSVVLLSGATLFARSFATLLAVDDGIEVDRVLVGRVNLSGDAYRGDAAKVAFFEELFGRLASSPGVEAVGGITFLPMDGLGAGTSYWPAEFPEPNGDDRHAADIRNVSGGYFEAMGIELLQGRLFDSRDRVGEPQTVVVNRALVERYWPGENGIGRSIVVNWIDHEPWEIVGVVEDVRMVDLSVEPRETVYISHARATFFPWLQVTLRSTGDPAALQRVVRAEVADMDATLPIGSLRVMQEVVDGSVARPRMTTVILALFAALATLLSAVGLYGVLAYSVSQRVREIGVRVALGAAPQGVARLVVRQAARLVGVGLVMGLATAWFLSRWVSELVYGVSPSDPWSMAAAAVVLGAVSLAACVVPAARASRVPPAEALRTE